MRLQEFVLLEAQNYEQMFEPILRAIPVEKQTVLAQIIAQKVKQARQILRRNDRVIWYLRLFRLFLLSRIEPKNFDPETVARLEALRRSMLDDYVRRSGLPASHVETEAARAGDLLVKLEHFLSLPISEIETFQFGWNDPRQVIQQFKMWEKEWQQDNKGSFHTNEVEGAEVILQFANNIAWYNLNKAYCPLEAQAMGHCGNQPRAHSSDRILSLRQTMRKKEHEFLRPYCTFILLEDGTLGEMKGRYNKSPLHAFEAGYAPSDFHNEIAALLKLPMIKGITGGGYMPSENFKLSDLPEALANSLIEMKPSLLSPLETYQRFGMSDELGQRIMNSADQAGQEITWHPEVNGFEVAEFPSMNKFIETMVKYSTRNQRRSTALWIAEVIEGGEHLEYYEGADDWNRDEVLNALQKTHPEAYQKLHHIVAQQYREENGYDDDEDMDDDDLPSLRSMITELDGEISSALDAACLTGLERGAENEMYEAFKKWVDNLKQPGGDYWIKVNDQHWADGPVSLFLDAPKVIEWMQQDFDENVSEFCDIRDIDEPRYGYSGFDAEAALDYFKDEVQDRADIDLFADAEG